MLAVVGRFWIRALQYAVVPLILTQALVAVLATERLGSLGGKTVLLFAAMLVGAAILTLFVSPLVISLYRPDPDAMTALRSGVTVPESLRTALAEGPAPRDWLSGFLPSDLGRFLRGGNLLAVVASSMVLGLLLRLLREPTRGRVRAGVARAASAVMRVMGWVLFFAPIGVLALTFGFARGAGGAAVGFVSVYIVMVCGMLLLFTALLYPLVVLVSKVPLQRFARALAPAQLVALGTRSSVATLPTMVEASRTRLALPPAGTGFVLPLAVATFKQNMGVSHPFMLLFLAATFGVALSAGAIVTFVVTVVLFSFATPGIPGGNPGLATMPIFMAAGMPIEGLILLDAVDPIPDIFKTLINVTADMGAATMLTATPGAASASEGP